MDLYSAAKRLTRPFVFREDTRACDLPLSAHGLIGDGFSAALVRVDGTIDWLCFPRFDSPSVFASILDEERGGHTAVTPLQRPFETLQHYDPHTNVLETLFRVPERGVLRITDLMPWSDDPRLSMHEVHRRIQCVEGEVELCATFDPRFDYGREEPRIDRAGEGVVALGSRAERLAAVLGGGVAWESRPGGGLQAKFTMRAGERRWMVLSWGSTGDDPVVAYRPFEHLRSTRRRWREWSSHLEYDGPWRHHVVRSALLLKLLIYAPSGAMVAAPTTSLPEWLGGSRNWDYRYTWSRDTAMAIRAANLLGFSHEARDFFHFVRDTLVEDVGELPVMYAVDGKPVQEETILTHLRGFQNSGPVRIGNEARGQLQLDTTGELIDAAYLYEHIGGSLTLRAWRKLRTLIHQAGQSWQQKDHGIWEPRGVMRHNVHSKLLSWVALERGARLAPLFGDLDLGRRWSAEAGTIRTEILERGVDKCRSHFTAAYDHDHVDSSLLLLPVHGLLEASDPRVLQTINRVRQELGTGPFLHRYRAEDGLEGEEGSFLLCGFWLAEALAMAGRIEEAQEVFLAHADASNHLGLLAEEIDPTSGVLLGNFPQAFSHLGLINAAVRIDRALRRRDEAPHSSEVFLP